MKTTYVYNILLNKKARKLSKTTRVLSKEHSNYNLKRLSLAKNGTIWASIQKITLWSKTQMFFHPWDRKINHFYCNYVTLLASISWHFISHKNCSHTSVSALRSRIHTPVLTCNSFLNLNLRLFKSFLLSSLIYNCYNAW